MQILKQKEDRPTFICNKSLIRVFAILQFLTAESCFLLHLHLIFLLSWHHKICKQYCFDMFHDMMM